jgi:hypothetical protein
MASWTFLDYETEGGEIPIRSWYKVQAEDVQAVFRDTVLQLGRRQSWEGNPLFGDCTKRHKGLSELRFATGEKRDRTYRRFRSIGICYPARMVFLFLIGCEKFVRDHGRTEPRGAFDMAMKLKGQFDQQKGRTHDHSYD